MLVMLVLLLLLLLLLIKTMMIFLLLLLLLLLLILLLAILLAAAAAAAVAASAAGEKAPSSQCSRGKCVCGPGYRLQTQVSSAGFAQAKHSRTLIVECTACRASSICVQAVEVFVGQACFFARRLWV